jgi:YD repeat-containing protein
LKNINKPRNYIKTKRDVNFASKSKKLKRFKKESNIKNQQASNFSLDMESLTDTDDSVNSIYYLKTNNLVNLKIEYNKKEKTEIYQNSDSTELFRIQYNELGLPVDYISNNLVNTNLNYDNNGRLLSLKRGTKLKEEYVYDLKGRLIEVKYNNGDSLKYSYAEGILVSTSIISKTSLSRILDWFS